MKWYFYLIIALLLVIIILIIITHFACKKILYPKRASREEMIKHNLEQGYYKLEDLPVRHDIKFIMKDNYVLNGNYFLNGDSKKYMILHHGHGSNREGILRYGLIFYKLGYNLIVYDSRSHGDNIFKKVTMGHYESKDLVEVIKQVKEKFGQDIDLNLFGVSMGSATILLSLALQQEVNHAICDCGYGKLDMVIHDELIKMHIPPFIFIPLMNLYLKVFAKFSFKDVSAINTISENKVPILYIHGEKDSFVNVIQSKLMYEKTNSIKRLEIFSEADHVKSLTVDKARYEKIVSEFLSNQ